MDPIKVGAKLKPGQVEATYAENQKEYRPLPSVTDRSKMENPVYTRWRLNDAEKAQIAAGEDIFLVIWTFGSPLQPVRLEVGPPPEIQLKEVMTNGQEGADAQGTENA